MSRFTITDRDPYARQYRDKRNAVRPEPLVPPIAKQAPNPFGYCGCTCDVNDGPGEHAADCPAGAA